MTDTNLHQLLRQLARKACFFPTDSQERQQRLDHLTREMLRSGKLWRGNVPQEAYQDILQTSWVYFCSNLCKARTAKEAYNPERASPLTWINAYIKMRVLDYYLEIQRERIQTQHPTQSDDGNLLDPLDRIPSPPEIPPILQDMLDWIEHNRIALRRVHVRDRPDINCYVLILRRLPPNTTSWKDLAQEFRASEDTLRGFYRRECLPRLRNEGKNQGYL